MIFAPVIRDGGVGMNPGVNSRRGWMTRSFIYLFYEWNTNIQSPDIREIRTAGQRKIHCFAWRMCAEYLKSETPATWKGDWTKKGCNWLIITPSIQTRALFRETRWPTSSMSQISPTDVFSRAGRAWHDVSEMGVRRGAARHPQTWGAPRARPSITSCRTLNMVRLLHRLKKETRGKRRLEEAETVVDEKRWTRWSRWQTTAGWCWTCHRRWRWRKSLRTTDIAHVRSMNCWGHGNTVPTERAVDIVREIEGAGYVMSTTAIYTRYDGSQGTKMYARTQQGRLYLARDWKKGIGNQLHIYNYDSNNDSKDCGATPQRVFKVVTDKWSQNAPSWWKQSKATRRRWHWRCSEIWRRGLYKLVDWWKSPWGCRVANMRGDGSRNCGLIKHQNTPRYPTDDWKDRIMQMHKTTRWWGNATNWRNE